jgi:hypothetical protein
MESDVMAARDEGVVLDHDHPWPGLVSFTEANYSFFFGREREVAELARLVRQETLTVFFGKSGLGKSSILRAGLSPLLRESDFIPIYIRLNHAEAAPPLEDQVEVAIEKVLEQEQVEAPKPVRAETLWEYFHKRESDWWDADNRLIKPILVFDQFEELMTLGQENPARADRTAKFLTELEDLIENRPPAALVARFKADPNLAERFDHRRSGFRVILSLREDFLPDLEGLRERLSPVMRNRYRLLPMNGEQALEVILKPGGHLVDEEVAIRIVDLVSSSERSRLQSEVTRAHLVKRAIEPALLSVVLQELNNRRIKAGQQEITAELVGTTNAAEIFHDFYLRGLQGMDDAVREFIEDSLLTSSGARNRIAEEDALTRPGISADILAKLIDRRIIQRETTGNVKWLELTHDTLADVVRADRIEHRQERELKLAAVREKETRLKLRRFQKYAAAFAILLIAALIALLYATNQKRLAQNAQRSAQKAQELTTQTTDRLAAGILRKIEQNPRIRVNEKLFLAQRLIDSVRELQKSAGRSGEIISMRLADLLATASLMFFDAGNIDKASDYAQQAHALIEAAPRVPPDMPLVIPRVELAYVLAQRFTWQITEEQALTALDRIEAQLRNTSIQQPDDMLLAQILKGRLAWTRSDTQRYQTRLETADTLVVAAISEIEEKLPSRAPSQDDAHTVILQNLTHELLKLYALRYRIAISGGKPEVLNQTHAGLEKALAAARSRFPDAAEDLWSFFEAKDLEVKASVLDGNGDSDQALKELGTAIGEFHQLLLDDPRNMFWRYELGVALNQRAGINALAGDPESARLAKLDRDAAQKLAITLRRDQQNPYFSFRLACLLATEDSAAEAASFLARVNLEEERFGPKAEFNYVIVFAHRACLEIELKKKHYAAAIEMAKTGLDAIDRLQMGGAETTQRISWRLAILGDILAIDADELGRADWLAFYAAAEGDIQNLLQVSKGPSNLSIASFVVSKRGEQYARERQYREAITAFKLASSSALDAIAGEEDQRIDLQNYLYSQGKIVENHALLSEWNAALDVCRETRTRLSALVQAKPKLVAVYSYVAWMSSLIDKARKPLEDAHAAAEEAAKTGEGLASESNAFKQQAEDFKRAAMPMPVASVSRIDLQLALDEFRSGTKENYWLVKQRLGWADAPIYPAAWRTIIGKEFDEMAALVALKKQIPATQIQRIRTCQLSFYEEGRLIEAEYADYKGDVYTVSIIAAPAAVYLLNGTSPPIHEANAAVPLHLQNAADAVAYLRFFCGYVTAENGAFQIVENAMDVAWAATAPAPLKKDVGRLLRPLVVWPDPEGNGNWRARATVQYSNTIFHTNFKIQKSGAIEMLDDIPVAADMPFNVPVYKGGDRSADKLETLDLTMVDPPGDGDEVEALLSIVESKKTRPAHYLDLANEAAALQVGISSAFGGSEDPSLAKLAEVIKRACKANMEAGNYKDAAHWNKELARLLATKVAQVEETDKSFSALQLRYLGTLLNLSWCQLYTKDFPAALGSTEAGLKLHPASLPLQTNRAHALLFLGRTAEAEELYRKYIGQKIEADSQKTWEQVVLDDFDQLEKDGLHNPQFDRIRDILTAKH